MAWGFGVAPTRLKELGNDLRSCATPGRRVISPTPCRNCRWPGRHDDAAQACRHGAGAGNRVARRRHRSIRASGSDLLAGRTGPLITWPLVITRPPDGETDDEANVGVYRMQVIGRDRAILRWLAHRGGARHHHQWKARGTTCR